MASTLITLRTMYANQRAGRLSSLSLWREGCLLLLQNRGKTMLPGYEVVAVTKQKENGECGGVRHIALRAGRAPHRGAYSAHQESSAQHG